MSADGNEARAGGRPSVPVDLALQGGGSHGAFTWGVLDRLLEEPWLSIEGISGTSAGAMNAAVLARRPCRGRQRAARARRSRRSGAAFPRPPPSARSQRSPLDVLLGRWTLDHSPAYVAMDMMARVFSPYDLNPRQAQSAARDPVETHRLRRAWRARRSSSSSPRPTCAPAARACSAMPSSPPTCCWPRPACPPCSRRSRSTARPIGTAATAGNPTMTPLMRECESSDTILVPINPVERPGMPRSARDILNRLNEVSFNAVLLKELRMIALLRQVAEPGNAEGAQWARMRIHMIAQRHAGRARCLLQAQRRMGVPQHAARRGPACGRCLPCGARRRYRAALDARHRPPARGR